MKRGKWIVLIKVYMNFVSRFRGVVVRYVKLYFKNGLMIFFVSLVEGLC